MIVEIVLAVVAVEALKSFFWTYKECKQKKEKFDFHIQHLRESKTWSDLFRKADELRECRPDLYKDIPKPILIKIIHRIYPNLK